MTKIEWTDAVWNPVTGCSKVSAGCKNCYAEGVANRFWGERKFTDVRCHEDRLDVPLRWRKPRRVFVNSMSDLFHDDVRDDFIDRVFATMQLAPHHTFQILTKRPERMRDYMTTRVVGESQGMTYGDRIRLVGCKLLEAMPNRLANATCKRVGSVSQHPTPWPLPNVWLGVSCEDQRAADERIPLLLETPAAVRFVSVEPLLERVNLWPWDSDPKTYALVGPRKRRRATTCAPDIEGVDRMPASLDWVIVGGESGPGARPCDVAWIRSIVRQCKESSVPVFVKQLGRHPRGDRFDMSEASFVCVDAAGWSEHDGRRLPLRDRKGGDTAEWGDELRVREFPRGGA